MTIGRLITIFPEDPLEFAGRLMIIVLKSKMRIRQTPMVTVWGILGTNAVMMMVPEITDNCIENPSQEDFDDDLCL